MKLEVNNTALQKIVLYLPELQLTGRGNRARQKLQQKAVNKTKEFYSDFEEIKAEHENDVKKQEEGIKELLEETAVIDMTEHANHMRLLYNLMLDYPHEISTSTIDEDGRPKTSDAVIHDYIIDVLEDAIENNDESQKKSENMEDVK